jgi:thiamine-monophosphate kinase
MKNRLSNTNEFDFIERIKKITRTGPSVVRGIGDDCAVLRYKKNKHLLFAADMLIEGVHFISNKDKPEAIGHKALAVNISDIAACGGIPRYALISVGMPSVTSHNYAIRLYRGIGNLARYFKIDLVGGDTNFSKKIIVSIAVLGEVLKKDLLLRSGAKNKDVIVLSGALRKKPDHLMFMPKIEKSQLIIKNLSPSAMIDISDGFLSDLGHILEDSKRGALIYESLIPCKDRKYSFNNLLNTGEQFELLFTMPANRLKMLPKGFYPVGEIMPGREGITLVDSSGKKKRVKPRGYTHF